MSSYDLVIWTQSSGFPLDEKQTVDQGRTENIINRGEKTKKKQQAALLPPQEVAVEAVRVGRSCNANSVLILIIPKVQTCQSQKKHSPGCMTRQPDVDCGMICYSELLELNKRKQTKWTFKLLCTVGTIQMFSQ